MNFSKEILAVFTTLYTEEEAFRDSQDTQYSYRKSIRTQTGTLRITRTLNNYIRVTFKDIDGNTIYYKEIGSDILKEIYPTALDFVNNIVYSTDGQEE